MDRISMQDIDRRVNLKTTAFDESAVIPNRKVRLYTDKGIFCEENALSALYSYNQFSSDTNTAYNVALDIFEELCYNSKPGVIDSAYNFLHENVDKVRDANQLINSIKYRTSRVKSKIGTKINNRIASVTDAINNSIGNINRTINTVGQPSGVAKTSSVEVDKNADKTGVAEGYFTRLGKKAAKTKQCDRILSNYIKVNKRFNINKIVSESCEAYDAAYSIAFCLDTYVMDFKRKYNTALETAMYGLSSNNIVYENSDIINGVTDYFIFETEYFREVDTKKDLKDIKDNSSVLTPKEFDCIAFLYDVTQQDNVVSIDDIDPESWENNFGYISETITQTIKDGFKPLSKEAKQDNEVSKMIDDFREKCAKDFVEKKKKDTSGLKALVTKLFTRTPKEIIDNIPSIFTIIRASFVLGSFAIHPVLGIVNTITMEILKLNFSRSQCERMLRLYEKEYDRAKSKAEKAKDEDSKERWTKYKDQLKKDAEKIRQYDSSNFTDEENDNRDTYGYSFDSDDFDFDFDDDDFNMDDWEESAKYAASSILISSILESVAEVVQDKDVNAIIRDNIMKLPNDGIDAVTDLSITVPVLLERNKLHETLVEYRNQLSSSDYIRRSCVSDNIYKLENSMPNYDDITMNTIGVISCMCCLKELAMLDKDKEYINEMNFTNTLKLAVNNLKRTAIKLKDKEKEMSNTIDISMNTLTKGIEQALMVENRESVIRGKIIPSASKCIKIALVVGAAWAISPAIAVIGSIGAFAASAKLRDKERQLILDDIELELKMVERYIKQAEDKEDLKKVREYEKMQRNLIRQQQRIKYNMSVEHNQPIHHADNDDD